VRPPTAEFCFKNALTQYFNLSDSHDPIKSPFLIQAGVAAFETRNTVYFFSEHTTTRYIVLPWCTDTSKYGFATIVQKIYTQNLNNLTQPFDRPLWIVLAVCVAFLIGYYILLQQCSKRATNDAMGVIFVLLEQIPSQFVNTAQTGVVISLLWVAVTIVLSNAYRGVLFELMTTGSTFQVPRKLEEISKYNFHTFTFSMSFIQERNSDHDRRESTVRILINNTILQTASKVDKLRSTEYAKLKNSLDFVDRRFNVPKFVSAVKNDLKIWGESTNMSVPGKFIVVDKFYILGLFKQLIHKFTFREVIIGESLEEMTMPSYWVSTRNFFLKLVNPILQRYDQSGLNSRWVYYEKIWTIYQCLSTIEQNGTNLGAKAFIKSKPAQIRPTPITVKFFSVFAILYSYCFAVSAIFFVCEFFWTRLILGKTYCRWRLVQIGASQS